MSKATEAAITYSKWAVKKVSEYPIPTARDRAIFNLAQSVKWLAVAIEGLEEADQGRAELTLPPHDCEIP